MNIKKYSLLTLCAAFFCQACFATCMPNILHAEEEVIDIDSLFDEIDFQTPPNPFTTPTEPQPTTPKPSSEHPETIGSTSDNISNAQEDNFVLPGDLQVIPDNPADSIKEASKVAPSPKQSATTQNESRTAKPKQKSKKEKQVTQLKARKPFTYQEIAPENPVYKRSYDERNAHLPEAYGAPELTERLFQAVADDDIGAIKALIKRGVNINAANQINGFTPLMYALAAQHYRSFELLIILGADLAITNSAGDTIAHIAAQKKMLEWLELLMTYGADVSAKNLQGHTPLNYLNTQDQWHITKLLIEKDQDVQTILPTLYNSKNYQALSMVFEQIDPMNLTLLNDKPLFFQAVDDKDINTIKLMLDRTSHNLTDALGVTGLSPYQYVIHSADSFEIRKKVASARLRHQLENPS